MLKLESSKATAHHIKQVAEDPQAAQINLLRHHCRELPTGKYKKKRPPVKPKQSNHKQQSSESYQAQALHKKRFDPKSTHSNKDRCSKCRDTAHIEGFQCPVKKYQCKACHKFGHFTSMCFQKKQANFKPRRPKAHQCKQVQFVQKEVPHMITQMKIALVKIHYACKSRSNAIRIKNKKFQDQHI